MLNCTSRKQVDQVRDVFFQKYPDAYRVRQSNPTELAQIIALLGFKNKRTHTIIRFSSDWISLDWSEPSELYGIGKYGQDSWEIFQKGNLDVVPTDGVLDTYLTWARTQSTIPNIKLV